MRSQIIIEREVTDGIQFTDLECGDVFEWDGMLYQRTNRSAYSDDAVVEWDTGRLMSFEENTPVTRVNVRLQIMPYMEAE